MRPSQYTFALLLLLIFCQVSVPAYSQLGISFNLIKPKEFEDQPLRSEKSEEKKFTLFRRLIQNTVTHYNYFYNANNKLNDVLEKAKTANQDDYSELLSFYNYSLEVTQRDSIQLDSVTYKSSTAIALHDLRNDWIDNMYLLWGASYYLQKKFDSAYLMFQFINYAFAPKEKDGYYRTIGSKQDGYSAFSISSKEKKSLPRKIFSEPPSRNDAFIWQIRNFLAQDQFAEAASLIVALISDPVFPKRLQKDLHEVQSLWFYKQKMWDSAAVHLVKALDNATNQQEKARWEYLAAQLFELSGNYKESEKYFSKVSSHTTDPIMDIYARLFAIRVNKDDGEKTIEKNVAQLVKMAKRDKYLDYRDIIYFMAARMHLEGNNADEAMALLLKSTKYTSNDPSQRNKAFLQLAELSFRKKQYRQAFNFYDSIRMDDPALKNKEELLARKKMLGGLATNIEIIERQDSLQRIAAMPEDERKEFVKKLVKQLRKSQGLKDEPSSSAGSSFVIPATQTLFPATPSKGEWYFYNAASRTRGQSDFKARWGNRPNIDNWRRTTAISGMIAGQNNLNTQGNVSSQQGVQGSTPELSFDRLYANLPLADDQVKRSNDSLKNAMFELGKIYVQEIEDCIDGTQTFEQLRTRFPEFQPMDEVLFNLYYCYNKTGNLTKADAIKKLMIEEYKGSNFTTIVTTGKNPQSKTANPDATLAYEKIYDLFIEGSFEQAVKDKKSADSIYGKNFWTPQLLYIEAVYYIKQQNDSVAQRVLNNILSQFPNTPMADKAAALIDVLSRREQIETELRNLVITRNQGDTSATKSPTYFVQNTNPVLKDSTKTIAQPVAATNKPPADSLTKKPDQKINSPYTFSAGDQHYVVLVLNKVDPVFINEAKNAFARYNRERFYNKPMSADLADMNAENRLLLISPFKDAAEAIDYIDKTRPKTATEIIPWLRGGKYYFIILSDKNYDLLKVNQDLDNYKAFLNEHFPGKF